MKIVILILALSALALSTVSSWSGDTSPSGTLQVNFEYGVSECRVDLGEGVLNFGAPDKLNKDIKMNATIQVKCPKNSTYWVVLSAGRNSVGGNVARRRMKGADGNFIAYQLYKDSNYEVVWGLIAPETQGVAIPVTYPVKAGKTPHTTNFRPSDLKLAQAKATGAPFAADFKADGTIRSHTIYGLIKSADLAKALPGTYLDEVTIMVQF